MGEVFPPIIDAFERDEPRDSEGFFVWEKWRFLENGPRWAYFIHWSISTSSCEGYMFRTEHEYWKLSRF